MHTYKIGSNNIGSWFTRKILWKKSNRGVHGRKENSQYEPVTVRSEHSIYALAENKYVRDVVRAVIKYTNITYLVHIFKVLKTSHGTLAHTHIRKKREREKKIAVISALCVFVWYVFVCILRFIQSRFAREWQNTCAYSVCHWRWLHTRYVGKVNFISTYHSRCRRRRLVFLLSHVILFLAHLPSCFSYFRKVCVFVSNFYFHFLIIRCVLWWLLPLLLLHCRITRKLLIGYWFFINNAWGHTYRKPRS